MVRLPYNRQYPVRFIPGKRPALLLNFSLERRSSFSTRY
jgi:hypothetical protein